MVSSADLEIWIGSGEVSMVYGSLIHYSHFFWTFSLAWTFRTTTRIWRSSFFTNRCAFYNAKWRHPRIGKDPPFLHKRRRSHVAKNWTGRLNLNSPTSLSHWYYLVYFSECSNRLAVKVNWRWHGRKCIRRLHAARYFRRNSRLWGSSRVTHPVHSMMTILKDRTWGRILSTLASIHRLQRTPFPLATLWGRFAIGVATRQPPGRKSGFQNQLSCYNWRQVSQTVRRLAYPKANGNPKKQLANYTKKNGNYGNQNWCSTWKERLFCSRHHVICTWGFQPIKYFIITHYCRATNVNSWVSIWNH